MEYSNCKVILNKSVTEVLRTSAQKDLTVRTARSQGTYFHPFARNSRKLLIPELPRKMYMCINEEVKVKQSLYRPGQGLTDPGVSGLQNF